MGKKAKVNKVFHNALENIKDQSQEVLCDIYWTLNIWEWHESLGEKPNGYDELPSYNIRFIDKLLRRETKHDYIKPIMAWIAYLVPIKTRYKYNHVIKKKYMTEQEFEDWYDSVRDDLRCFEPRL